MAFIGTDIIEVERVRKLVDTYTSRFLSRIFSKDEIKYCLDHRDPAIHFAGRFSAKEAVKKAISSVYAEKMIPYNKISIRNDKKGRPYLDNTFLLSANIDISISHTKKYAISFAILNDAKRS